MLILSIEGLGLAAGLDDEKTYSSDSKGRDKLFDAQILLKQTFLSFIHLILHFY